MTCPLQANANINHKDGGSGLNTDGTETSGVSVLPAQIKKEIKSLPFTGKFVPLQADYYLIRINVSFIAS